MGSNRKGASPVPTVAHSYSIALRLWRRPLSGTSPKQITVTVVAIDWSRGASIRPAQLIATIETYQVVLKDEFDDLRGIDS